MVGGLNSEAVIISELKSNLLRCSSTVVCIYGQIGDMISSKGGVVSAEELAPYLDVPAYSEETKASYVYLFI